MKTQSLEYIKYNKQHHKDFGKNHKCARRSGKALTPLVNVESVIFEQLDGKTIQDTAKTTFGSVVPTLIEADGWTHILCSKSFGKTSDTLAQSIADMEKQLCSKKIPPDPLSEHSSCRLIPLNKNPGVRPIGIGEVHRQIIGKAVAV